MRELIELEGEEEKDPGELRGGGAHYPGTRAATTRAPCYNLELFSSWVLPTPLADRII